MATESYSKIAGKKTLVLISALIGLVIILTIYIIFIVIRRSGVLTNSISIEKPVKLQQVSKAPIEAPKNPIRDQGMPTRFGD